MQITDFLNVLSCLISKIAEDIQCVICDDGSCFNIIINNFYNRLI